MLQQPGHTGKQAGLGIGQPVDEILENVAQHRLGGGEDQEADDAEQEKTNIRLHVSQQPKINSDAGSSVLLGIFCHIRFQP